MGPPFLRGSSTTRRAIDSRAGMGERWDPFSAALGCGSTPTMPRRQRPSTAKSNLERGPLDLARVLSGRRLVVVGGTGFLGKVWWTFLLHHFPEVERIYLVMRTRGGQTAEQRFWQEIATNECLRALREQHGSRFEAFLRDKIVPLAGDVVHPLCGLDAGTRDELRGSVDAVINASGVVDFDPPLDEALEVNAFGVQNLVTLARDLGGVPFLHTSTCFVAGARTGIIEETDPREHPFPRAAELERAHWEPDREISECLDVIEQARHRASDAFRQSRFLEEAKKNLSERGEPARGATLDKEVERVKRKFVEARLAEMGMERAHFWGFPNTYTYTKAIGEQIVAGAEMPHTIVRPAIVESTVKFPFPGWNEGVNTSAPLIYALREGQTQIPGGDNYLDMIPCDMVAGGMTLALGELLEGTPRPVYQFGSSDSNPCTMRRFFELSGLYKRAYWQKTGRGGPLVSKLQSRFEGALLDDRQFASFGPGKIAQGVSFASRLLKKVAVGPAAPLLSPTAKLLDDFATQQQKVNEVLTAFVPFTAVFDYVFRCDNTRAAYARLGAERKEEDLLGARGHRLARLVPRHPRPRPRKVGVSADRRAHSPAATGPRAPRRARRLARRDGRALRPRGGAPAHGGRRPLPPELPGMARALDGVRRTTRGRGRRARRSRVARRGESPSVARCVLRHLVCRCDRGASRRERGGAGRREPGSRLGRQAVRRRCFRARAREARCGRVHDPPRVAGPVAERDAR